MREVGIPATLLTAEGHSPSQRQPGRIGAELSHRDTFAYHHQASSTPLPVINVSLAIINRPSPI